MPTLALCSLHVELTGWGPELCKMVLVTSEGTLLGS